MTLKFGDHTIWTNDGGIPAEILSVHARSQSLLKGQHIRSGLDITVIGELPKGGTFAVTLKGKKPTSPRCK